MNSSSPRALIEQKNQLLRRIASEGSNFRTTSQERADFKAAFLAKHDDGHGSAEYVWKETAKIMRSVQKSDPALKDMKIEDLIALRAWTGGDYLVVQDVLDTGSTPSAIGLAFAKPLISAIHALPESYVHTGTVYTGESQTAAWVHARHRVGEVSTSQRFFATAATKEGAWQNMSVDWETQSLRGKQISSFSSNPGEQEVLFPPGTQFETHMIDEQSEPGKIKIYQSEYLTDS